MKHTFQVARYLILGLTLSSSFAIQCQAFSLRDHEQITKIAVEEFNLCHPGAITEGDLFWMNAADLEEDLNVLRKWLSYSHFYHPEKPLDDMVRQTSGARVSNLENKIELQILRSDESSYSFLVSVGHLLHHVQDMASPPHVVPVMHNLSDGFESLKVTLAKSLVPNCESLQESASEEIFQIFQSTAEQTLTTVRTEKLDAITSDGDSLSIPATWFWKESDQPHFGEYGVLGNEFGTVALVLPDQKGTAEVSPMAYILFKAKQLRLAVESTKKILAHAFANQVTHQRINLR